MEEANSTVTVGNGSAVRTLEGINEINERKYSTVVIDETVMEVRMVLR